MGIFTKVEINELSKIDKNDKQYIVDDIARSLRKRSELNDYIVELTKSLYDLGYVWCLSNDHEKTIEIKKILRSNNE